MIVLKRIYDKTGEKDGYRILIDRLWPRGVSKEDAKINLWLKEVAPSNELRKWFSHPSKYQEKLNELNNNRTTYRNALKQLVDSHREMNKIFEKYLPPKKSIENF